MNALCFSACLCFSLLGFAIAGVAAKNATTANDQLSATSTETQPERASGEEDDRLVNQLIDLIMPKNTDQQEQFRLLRERRRRITNEMDFNHDSILDAKDYISYLERKIDDLEGRKHWLEQHPESPKDLKLKEAIIKDINDSNKEIEKADQHIVGAENRLDKLGGAIPEIDAKLSELLSFETREGDFRLGMSKVYAGLVAFLIMGFFASIWMSGKGSEVFSNQQGLQFITLLSLVIAIILFGVLKILQAKELSALLGAISGYVLGRVSAGEVKSAISRAPPAAAGAAGGGGTDAPATSTV